MRGFIVGAPPLIVMQRLTGGSRPYETNEGSEWHPFRDNNGVSGHAFMSSLPFITGAKMTDNPWEKSLWYLGSTLGPLSRVNDNAHYPSQIGMSWCDVFFCLRRYGSNAMVCNLRRHNASRPSSAFVAALGGRVGRHGTGRELDLVR